MEVKGKIIQKFDLMSGTSKAGNAWKKQEYLLETLDSFPRKIHFDFFGDRADQYPLNVGDMVNLSFDIESREYQGRWYTSIRGWKAEKIDEATAAAPQTAQAPQGAPAPAPVPLTDTTFEQSPADDLPF
ncbi:MAG: DUF3127 domain-containing protein [Muribaculaceae bacterium]|nr:DUF3127 domain-containing protein [Muribaculaceae bacterium]MBR0025297.1 DUF3127 domain-containing protein [Muribaculaceae bacterium]